MNPKMKKLLVNAAMAGRSSASQQARVFRWFRSWIREGLFQRLTVA